MRTNTIVFSAVVKCFGAVINAPNRQLSLILELVASGSLFDLLHKRQDLLDRPSLLRIIREVCEGVAYLHNDADPDFSIIHRDIKPGNILIHQGLHIKSALNS
jgi:serine/threonine protein kinase